MRWCAGICGHRFFSFLGRNAVIDLFESQEVTIPELLRRIEALEAIVMRNEEPLRTAKPLSCPEHLRLAWARWDAYRRTGKRWTADAKRLNIGTLVKLAKDAQTAEAIVVRSIEHSWTALYALPEDKPASSIPQIKTKTEAMTPCESPAEAKRAWIRQQYDLGQMTKLEAQAAIAALEG